MKKLMIALVACLSLFSAVNVKSADAVPSLFNAGEVGLSLSSGVNVNPKDSVSTVVVPVESFVQSCEGPQTTTRTVRDSGEKTVNFTVGAFWFPTRLLGLEANLPVYRTDDVSIQEVQAGLLLRLPLARSTPLLKHLAPYGGVGTVYNWEEGTRWSYVVKGGLDLRFTRHCGIFGEFQHRNVDFRSRGVSAVQGGLKLNF